MVYSIISIVFNLRIDVPFFSFYTQICWNKQIEYVLLLALMHAHCFLLLGPRDTRCRLLLHIEAMSTPCLLHCMWTSTPCLLVIRDMG
jgi:hypothetical protein